MARTVNGNLTGKAAQTAIRELNEQLQEEREQRIKFHAEFTKATDNLRDMLGAGFDEWWDSYPSDMTKRDFLPIMKAKVAELEQQQQAKESTYISEWLDEPAAISGGEIMTRGEMMWIGNFSGNDDISF